MDGQLASVLNDAFPGREVDSLLGTGPSWNEANRTVGVEFADGERAYLKVATDGDGSRIARERAVLEFQHSTTDLPVPTVAACDPGTPVPYLATAPMHGEPLLDRWSESGSAERADLARRVGAGLARVHDERFEAHGHVVGGGAGGLRIEPGAWTDVLVDTIHEMRAIAPADRFDHHFDEVVAAVEANRDLLDGAPAALLHGDPAKPNCFLVDGRVGFIDWELAHVGDPARDLHRAKDQQLDPLRGEGPTEQVEAMYEGYRERAGRLPEGYEERVPVYEAVRFLGVSGYVERMAEFVGEPEEELAGWVEVEMGRLFERI